MTKKMNITINFDMDSCLCDLYGVENWLDYLIAGDVFPYETAEPLLRLSALARRLNNLQKNGYNLAVISWLSPRAERMSTMPRLKRSSVRG